MKGYEKCTKDIKLHVEPTLFNLLAELAHQEDRTLTDYVHHIVKAHVYGSKYKLDRTDVNQANRDY